MVEFCQLTPTFAGSFLLICPFRLSNMFLCSAALFFSVLEQAKSCWLHLPPTLETLINKWFCTLITFVQQCAVPSHFTQFILDYIRYLWLHLFIHSYLNFSPERKANWPVTRSDQPDFNQFFLLLRPNGSQYSRSNPPDGWSLLL